MRFIATEEEAKALIAEILAEPGQSAELIAHRIVEEVREPWGMSQMLLGYLEGAEYARNQRDPGLL